MTTPAASMPLTMPAELTAAELNRVGLLHAERNVQISRFAIFVPGDALGALRPVTVEAGVVIGAFAVVHGGTTKPLLTQHRHSCSTASNAARRSANSSFTFSRSSINVWKPAERISPSANTIPITSVSSSTPPSKTNTLPIQPGHILLNRHSHAGARRDRPRRVHRGNLATLSTAAASGPALTRK
jgi:hypothetical protein